MRTMGDFLLRIRAKTYTDLAVDSSVFADSSVFVDDAQAFFAWVLDGVALDPLQPQEKYPFGRALLAFAGAYS